MPTTTQSSHEYDLQLFNEIEAAIASPDGIVACYKSLYSTFRLLLEDMTRNVPTLFSGPYARMGYLTQKLGYSGTAIYHLNDFRSRARRPQTVPEIQLRHSLGQDLYILCKLIADCYQQTIPENLKRYFRLQPLAERKPYRYKMRIRAALQHVEQQFIYCTNLDDGGREIKVALTSGQSNHDFHYLVQLLWPGCQLNLVDTSLERDIIYPQLIVLEPDYLLSIGSIASSLGAFNADPRWSIVRLLETNEASPATLLGTLAGSLLDACLDGFPNRKPDYNALVRQFYAQNVLKIAECKRRGNDLSNFHTLGKQQLENIWHTLTTQLPTINGFDNEKVILEPSFFCELLGIQGRMDFLTTDYALLVEQKSGMANEFFALMNGITDPVPKEDHLAQIALYQAILHYSLRIPNSNISSLLLYSKYHNGLVLVNLTPGTLYKAMVMRNRIVYHLHELRVKGFRSVLASYTVASFNPNQKSMKLWNPYIKPRLEQFIASFQNANPLAQSYVCALLDFMLAEHLISKLGSSAQPYSGTAALWNTTPEEKIGYGSMIDGLKLLLPLLPKGVKEHPKLLRFMRPDDANLSQDNNFRYDDIVATYPHKRNVPPDACAGIVFRGRIVYLSAHEIHIELYAAQHSYNVLALHAEECWAVEHDQLEALFQRACASVYSFLVAPRERQELLLCQRKPRIDDSHMLTLHYPETPQEQEVATMVLKSQHARDYMLLIGPPGTGKTSIGLMRILQEELAQDNRNKVLILSFTNRAVDEVCQKLLEAKLDFIRIGHPSQQWPEIKEHLIDSLSLRSSNIEDYEQVLLQKRIFVATTASLIARSNLLQMLHFSLAIVDEASQILEPQIVGLLSAKHGDGCAIERFVLIGDQKQLPAVVQQDESQTEVINSDLRHIGFTNCNRSLFERLLSYQQPGSPIVHMLSKQGRMHPEVAQFPNTAFYNGQLTSCNLPHQQDAPLYQHTPRGKLLELLANKRTIFFNVIPLQYNPRARTNLAEAKATAIIVTSILQLYVGNKMTFDPQQSLGIIVPFRNQISSIRQLLQRTGIALLSDITIDTVERYQGSQRDIIIYSFTITHGFQLRPLVSNVYQEGELTIDRKLNVALTRARKQCIVLGCQAVLRTNPVYSQLMETYGPVYPWDDYAAQNAPAAPQNGPAWIHVEV